MEDASFVVEILEPSVIEWFLPHQEQLQHMVYHGQLKIRQHIPEL